MGENFNNMVNGMNIDVDQEIDAFIDDKIFTISMSGFFVKRLQAFSDWAFGAHDPNHMIKIYEKIVDKPDEVPADVDAYNVQTFLMLIQEIHKAAKEQGAMEKTTIRKMQESLENIEKSIQDTPDIVPDKDTGLDSHT